MYQLARMFQLALVFQLALMYQLMMMTVITLDKILCSKATRERNTSESLSSDSSLLLMDTGTADITNAPLQLDLSTHCVETDSLDLKGTLKKSHRKTKSSSSRDILRPKSSKQKHTSVKQKKQVQKWFDIPISRLRTQDLARSQETNDELERKNVDLMKEIVILQKQSKRLQALCEYLRHGSSFNKPSKSRASRPTSYCTSDETETSFSFDGSSQVKMQGASYKPFENPNVFSLLDMQESQDFEDLVEPNRGITPSCFHRDSPISGWRKLTDSCTIRNYSYDDRSSSITSPEQSVTGYHARSNSITSPIQSVTDYDSRSNSITTVQSATDYDARYGNAETCANIKIRYLPTTQNYVDPNLNDVSLAYNSDTLDISNSDIGWQTQKSFHKRSSITTIEKSMLLRSISTKDENLNHTVAPSPDYLSPVSPTRHSQSMPESPDSGILTKSPRPDLFLDENSEIFIKEEPSDQISSYGNFKRDNEYLAAYMRDSPSRTISKSVRQRDMNSSEGDDIRSCNGESGSEWHQRREGLSQSDGNELKISDRPTYITQSLPSDLEEYRFKDVEEFIKKETLIDSIVKDLMSPITDEMTSECEVFNFVTCLGKELPKDARADNLTEHHPNRDSILSELRQSSGLTSKGDQLVAHDQVPLITKKMSNLSCRSPDCLKSRTKDQSKMT
ncbi:mucin-17 [Biomphalaria pfeifferi]|uniref:Mucin-17 n=1 Tax=Biomphalaria pfeifferi TaxID=112525 RepID=A0AAD8BEG8_BIOPF|nr:mucin-17 [Biomphalaria pfeifferi]